MLDSNQKNYIKQHLKEYAYNNLEKSGGKDQYCCPFCNSGHKENHSGAFTVYTEKFHCYACDSNGDIFDLIEQVENLNKAESFERAAELYLDTTTTNKKAQTKDENAKSDKYTDKNKKSLKNENRALEQEKELKDERKRISDYIEKCHEQVNKTNYFLQDRKISQKAIDKFKLGYASDYKDPRHPEYNYGQGEAVIIPTSENTFNARLLATQYQNGNKSRKVNTEKDGSQLFNAEILDTATEPIFVVEGEIDALSFYSLTPSDDFKDFYGNQIKEFNAIAICGVGNVERFSKLVIEKKPKAPLILALDHDEKGLAAERKLAEKLRQENIFFIGNEPTASKFNIHNFLYQKTKRNNSETASYYKDINERLQAEDVQEMTELCYSVYVAAQEKAQERKTQVAEDYARENSAASHFEKFLQEIKENAKKGAVKTGFKNLDKVLDGGLYSGLYVLGAISSMGKSTFVLQIADQIAEQGKDVLIFSLEMPRSELFAKSISRLTRQIAAKEPYRRIQLAETTRSVLRNAVYNKDPEEAKLEIEIFEKAKEEYRQKIMNHIYIYEGMGNIGVNEITEVFKEHIEATGNTPIIIIDYLQILKPYEMRATDKQNTDKSILALKVLSREYKTTVIGISSFNRESYKKGSDGKTGMASFKESGAIEYSADVLIGLEAQRTGKDYNEEEVKRGENGIRKLRAKILKNRNGEASTHVNFSFAAKYNYYWEDEEQ